MYNTTTDNEFFPTNYELIDIVDFELLEPEPTYDIEVKTVHAFTAKHPKSNLESVSHNSATICLFSHDDEEMAKAKTGDWFINNPQRGRSNNSAVLVRSKTSKKEFLDLLESTRKFGEPGFVWVEDDGITVNPCVEIAMWPQTEDGRSGWQFCNLSEINGKKIKTPEDFYTACKAASIIGTIQAGYDTFGYLGKETQEITRREALLGVSITGMMDNPDVIFDRSVQKLGAEIVKKWNKKVSEMLGINQAARTTCVKPSGSACVGIDTEIKTSSGIYSMDHIFSRFGFNSSNTGDVLELNPGELIVYDENNVEQNVTALINNGTQPTFTIEFEDGKEYTFTADHKLKTSEGWKLIEDIKEGEDIICF